MNDTLAKLTMVLEQRKNESADSSYVASLYAAGLDKILEKVGEEAVETLIAAKNGRRDEVVAETADLWFHTLVMLSELGLSAEDIMQELEARFGLSGLEEKANRNR